MKQTILVAIFIIFILLIGCSRASKTKSTALTVSHDSDTVFRDKKPFDPKSYHGAMNGIESMGDNMVTFALYTNDGTNLKLYGLMDAKGKILLGSDGILAYPDAFRRIKFATGDTTWKEIGRKAIMGGRLFIETKGDKKSFTIHDFESFKAVIEPGIHL